VKCQFHALAGLPAGKARPIPFEWKAGWAGLGDAERRIMLPLPGFELRPLDRPARMRCQYLMAVRIFGV
jgi:hypothetical protein